MIVLFVLVLVIFGPQKLPELARTLGKMMAEFRKASTDFRGAFEEEMRNIERQAVLNERKRVEALAAAQPAQPASQGTPAESETPLLDNQIDADTRQTEAPAITPVAESVARSEEAPTVAAPESSEAVIPKSQDAINDHQRPA